MDKGYTRHESMSQKHIKYLNQKYQNVFMEEPMQPGMQNDGYKEAILYLFKKGDRILIENAEGREVVMPHTVIEDADRKPMEDEDQEDYRIESLLRHINTRFGENLVVNNYEYLGEFEIADIKARFYGFLINDWEGNIDDLSEKGLNSLEWVEISNQEDERLSSDSSKFFIDKVHEIERETNYIG